MSIAVVLLLAGLEALASPVASGPIWIMANVAVAVGTAAGVIAFRIDREPVVAPTPWSLLGYAPEDGHSLRDRLAA